MKKTKSTPDSDELLPEYDLRTLGPRVVGAVGDPSRMNAAQMQEAARVVALRESRKAVAQLRKENQEMRREIAAIKKSLGRLTRESA